MARKLKTYEAALGFFDTAVAAPSMKAALEIWGARSNLFHQGLAKESDDPETVAATLAKPGIVLKRPIGSGGPFSENPDLPDDFPGKARKRKPAQRSKARRASKSDDKAADRKGTLAYEKQRKQREREEREEEAEREKAKKHRDRAVAKVQAAIDKARRDHEDKARKIDAQRSAVEKLSHAEDARWGKQKRKLDKDLVRARD